MIAGRSQGHREARTATPAPKRSSPAATRRPSPSADGTVTKPGGLFSVRALASTNTLQQHRGRRCRASTTGRTARPPFALTAACAAGRHVYLEAGAIAEWTAQQRVRQRSVGGSYRPINDFSDDGGCGPAATRRRASTAGRLTLVPGVRADHWSLTDEWTVSPWMQAQVRARRRLDGARRRRHLPAVPRLRTDGRRAGRARQHGRSAPSSSTLASSSGSAPRCAGRSRSTTAKSRTSSVARGAEPRLVNDRVVRGSRSAPLHPVARRLRARHRGARCSARHPRGLSGWLSYSLGRNRYADRVTGESFYGDIDQRHTFNVYASTGSRTASASAPRHGSAATCRRPATSRRSTDRSSSRRRATSCGCRSTRASTSAPTGRSTGRAAA